MGLWGVGRSMASGGDVRTGEHPLSTLGRGVSALCSMIR